MQLICMVPFPLPPSVVAILLPKTGDFAKKSLQLGKKNTSPLEEKMKKSVGLMGTVWVIFGGNTAEDVVTFWRGIPWFNFWKYLCIKADQN